MRKLLTIFVLLFVSFCNTFSGGFQINDQSGRSVALGFSTVANPTDPSAIFYNPAAITGLDGTANFSVGASYIMPGAKFTGITSMNQNDTYELENWNFLIPHFYATWNTPIKNLSAGIGVFVPFGLGTRWPEGWIGRHLANETYLQTMEINPNIAYKFNLGGMPISIAAGFGYVLGNVEMKKTISTFNPEPVLDLKGDGTSTTFNFAVQAELMNGLKFGVSYRHNIEMDFEGNTVYKNVDGLGALFVEGTGKASINFPMDFRAGISYQITPNFVVEAGINYVGWSSYDTLSITFDKMPGNPTTSYTSDQPRLYNNVMSYRIGSEYLMEDLAIRCGFYYDPMPVDPVNVEPVLPEADRMGFSAGVGMNLLNNLSCDLGYLGILGSQTEVKNSPSGFDGYYNAWANVLSLTFSYKF
jgi:long-chain fatty acid transport protein